MKNDRFRINNFDLIRLFAALQVVFWHFIDGLIADPHSSWHWIVSKIWAMFPGVPIFFISGFLISRSYESNSRLSCWQHSPGCSSKSPALR